MAEQKACAEGQEPLIISHPIPPELPQYLQQSPISEGTESFPKPNSASSLALFQLFLNVINIVLKTRY